MPSSTLTVCDPETPSGMAAIHVTQKGSGNGIPLVFVHGMGADHYEFVHQVRYFSDKHQCVSFDQRGHGRSPSTFNMSIQRSTLDLEALVDHLELEKFVLVGHSMGSMVSFEYTAMHPERVEKLMIASGSPALRESLFSYIGLKIMARTGKYLDDKQKKFVSSAFGFNIGTFGLRTSPDVLQYYFQDNPFAFSDKFFTAQARYMEEVATFDFRDRLKEIKCPTLVTHGALDIGIYALPTLMAVRGIPDVRIHIFPTCGHSPNIEAPGEFNSRLEQFIRE